MLALPIAVGDKRVFQGLRDFLGSGADDVTVFELKRNAAVQASSESDLGHLLAYHHVLSSVVPRLEGYESEVKTEFCWSDPLIKSQGKLVSSKLHFDWGNVLWNWAALSSLQGAKLDLTTDESIRDACKLFQQACGAFDFIKQRILPVLARTQPPVSTSSLSESGLIFASSLMLAQASFCFYKKAVKDHKAGNMKAGIVSKLAKQTAICYGAAAAASKPETLKGDASWFAHSDFKAKCFHATAEYWQALALMETVPGVLPGKGYGEAIARLQLAEQQLRAASAVAQQYKLSAGVAAAAEELMQSVAAKKASAVKDNDTLYFQVVPPEAALTVLQPVAMAKSIPLPQDPAAAAGAGPAIFAKLVSASLRKPLLVVSERAAETSAAAAREASAATDAARLALSNIGLPSSLEQYKLGGGGIPDSLWQKVLQVQQQGGLGGLQALRAEFEAVSVSCASRLGHLETLLTLEDAKDNELGTAHLWSAAAPASSSGGGGTPRTDVLKDVRAAYERMRGAFEEAQANDASWSGGLGDAASLELLAFLELSQAQMLATVPKPEEPLLDLMNDDLGASSGRGGEPQVRELEALLVSLVRVIEARDLAVKGVSDVCNSDFVAGLTALGAAEGSPDAAELADQLLLPTAPHQAAIKQGLSEQEELLAKIDVANVAFQSLRATDPAAQARGALLKRIEMALAQHATISSNISQASSFYSSLERRLDALLQEAQDAVFVRQMVREEHLQQASQEQLDLDLARQLSAEMEAQAALSAAPPQQPGLPVQHPQLAQQSSQPPPYPVGAAPLVPPPAYSPYAGAPAMPMPMPMPMQVNVNGTPTQLGVACGTPVSGPPLSPAPSLAYQQQPQLQPWQQQQQQQQPLPLPPLQQQQQQQGQWQWQPHPQSQPQLQPPPQPQPQQQQWQQQYTYSPQGPPPPFPQQQQQHLPPAYPAAAIPPVVGIAPEPSRTQRMMQMGLTQAERVQLEEKVNRLAEMGFTDRAAVTDALVANGLNEELALNALLGQPTIAPGSALPAPLPPAPSPAPPKPSKPSGLFGLWGR